LISAAEYAAQLGIPAEVTGDEFVLMKFQHLRANGQHTRWLIEWLYVLFIFDNVAIHGLSPAAVRGKITVVT
jgi:hypothetical protein